MHDGSYISLKKIDDKSYDPLDYNLAMHEIKTAQQNKSILTGLLYHNPKANDFLSAEKINSQTALSQLEQKDIQPSQDQLNSILKAFK